LVACLNLFAQNVEVRNLPEYCLNSQNEDEVGLSTVKHAFS